MIHELKVQMEVQEGHNKPYCDVNERLTQTDALAAHEGSERHWVPEFTLTCECPFACLICGCKALRHKLVAFRPLVRVVMNSLKVNIELSSLQDFQNRFLTPRSIGKLSIMRKILAC